MEIQKAEVFLTLFRWDLPEDRFLPDLTLSFKRIKEAVSKVNNFTFVILTKEESH
jgi:hypothetical protein